LLGAVALAWAFLLWRELSGAAPQPARARGHRSTG
jgi:hypothetical protein